MQLCIRTTRRDCFWASVFTGALIGPGLFVSLLAWGIGTVFTVEHIWTPDAGVATRIAAALLVALGWGAAVVGVNLLINGLRLLRRAGGAGPREHTLTLGDAGLAIETTERMTFRRYGDMTGMRRWCGRWFVLDTSGIVVMFRPALVVAGDAAAFARELRRRMV
jgi:hypothetical protein